MTEPHYPTLVSVYDNFISFKDPYNHHGPKVRVLVQKLAEATKKFTPEELKSIERGASLHDVGKMYIDSELTNQPRRLTPLEMIEFQNHVELGVQLLEALNCNPLVVDAAAFHHEDWNGTGYPRKLKGIDIPVVGRLVRICDVFDAMTSERVYRKALSVEFTLKYIYQMRGILFDPDLVDIFIPLIEKK